MARRILGLPDGSTTSYDDEKDTFESALEWARQAYPEAFGSQAPEEGPSAWRRVPDVLVTGMKSAVAVPEMLTGLVDIPTLGAAGKNAEKLGIRFEETQKILSDLYSPQQKAANAAVEEAEGFLGKIAALSENPSAIATTVGESIAPMFAGGVAARGIKALAGVGDIVAAAAGEGLVGAGSAAEGIRQQTADGYLAPHQALAALGAGAGTAVLSAAGGAASRALGVADIDVAIANGAMPKLASKGFVRRIIEGGVSEGVFEEMPQSVQEQMWSNYALGHPIMEGVPEAAAMGVVTGGAMGAGINVFRGAQPQAPAPAPAPTPEVTPTPAAPLTPSETISYPPYTPSETVSYPAMKPTEEVAYPTNTPTRRAYEGLLKTREGTQAAIANLRNTVPEGTPGLAETLAQYEAKLQEFDASDKQKKVEERKAASSVFTQVEPAPDGLIAPEGDGKITSARLFNLGIHRGNKRLATLHDALVNNPDMVVDADTQMAALEEFKSLTGKTAPNSEQIAAASELQDEIAMHVAYSDAVAEKKRTDIEAAYAQQRAAQDAQEKARLESEMAGKGLQGLEVLGKKAVETEAAYAQRAAAQPVAAADEEKFAELQKEMAVPGTQFGLLGEIAPPTSAPVAEEDTPEPMDFANKRDFPGQSTLFKRNMAVNPQAVAQPKETQDAVQVKGATKGVLRSEGPQVGLQEVGKGDAKSKKPAAKGKVAIQEAVQEEVTVDPVITLAALSDISMVEKNTPEGKKARQYRQAAMKPDATETDLLAADAFVKDYDAKKTAPVERKAEPKLAGMRARRDEVAASIPAAEAAAEAAMKDGNFARIKNTASALAKLEMLKSSMDRYVAKGEAKQIEKPTTKSAPSKVAKPAAAPRESLVIEQELEDAKISGTDKEITALRKELAMAKQVEKATRVAAKPSKVEKEGLAAAKEAEDTLDAKRDAAVEDPQADAFQKMMAGAATVREALNTLLPKVKDPTFRAFIGKLLANPAVANTRVKFSGEVVQKAGTEDRVLGNYLPDSNVVVLHTGAGLMTFIHEVTHARTYAALRTNNNFKREIEKIHAEAKKLAAEKGVDVTDQYGLSSEKFPLDEFVAEIFANPEFVRLLDSLKPTQKESLLQRFVRALANALGLPLTPKTLGIVDSVVRLTDEYADSVVVPTKPQALFGAVSLNNVRAKPMSMADAVTAQNNAIDSIMSATTPITTTLGKAIDAAKLHTMTLSQIEQSYGRLFPEGTLKKVKDTIGELNSVKMDYIRQGEEIENDFIRFIDRAHVDRANEIMAEATLSGMFPDKTFEENVALGTIVNVDPEVGFVRTFNDLKGKYETLKKNMEATRKGSSAQFEDVFKRMYTHGSKLYTEKLNIIREKMGAAFDKELAEEEAKAKEGKGDKAKLRRLRRDMAVFAERVNVLQNRLKGPYFPLARFGNHLVIMRSDAYLAQEKVAQDIRKNLEVLEGNETMQEYDLLLTDVKNARDAARSARGSRAEEARARVEMLTAEAKSIEAELKPLLDERDKLRTDFKKADAALEEMASNPDEYEVSAHQFKYQADRRAAELLKDPKRSLSEDGVMVTRAEKYDESGGMPATRQFIDKLNESITGTMDAEDAAKLKSMMAVVMTELSMNETVRRQLHRRKVPGFDKDMFRGFSSMVRSDAHFLANLAMGDKLREAMADLRAESKSGRKENTLRVEVANAIDSHIQGQKSYDGKNLAGNIAAFTSVWTLLTSPAYVMANMTQPWIVSYPMLASISNGKSAATELTAGLAAAMKVIKAEAGRSAADVGFVKRWSNVLIDAETVRSMLGEEKGALVEFMLDKQLIDVSLSSDAGLNSNAGSSIREAVMKAIGAAPHITEVTNRLGTALAAYELAKKSNPEATKDELYAVVERVLDNTHFNYSAENEPLVWKRFPFAHVILQFKKYQEGMLYLVLRNAALATKRVPGATGAEIKAARTLLSYMAATHFAAAGAIGIPMSGALMGVIDAAMSAMGGDDEPWKTKDEMQKAVSGVFGEDFGLLVSKGLPAYLGVDLSQKIGAGDIASFARFTDDAAQGKEWYKSMLVNSMGPFFGGLMPRAFDGANYLTHGDYYKAVEKFSPSVVASTMKSARFVEEGLTTKFGNVAIKPEEFDNMDIFAKTLGFTPTRESEYYSERSKRAASEAYYKEQTSDLKEKYVTARESGEGMQEVLAEMREVNQRRLEVAKERGAKPNLIKFSDLAKAYKDKQKYEKERNQYGVRVRKSEEWMAD